MLPTIQGSGATSSPSAAPVAAAGSEGWLPTETTEGPTREQPRASAVGSGPRIVLETSDGHSMALDADDLMLVIMAVLLTIEIRRAV